MFYKKTLCLVAFILSQQIKLILSDCTNGMLYQHLFNCRLFYQCSNGRLIELGCPEGQYFNPSENVCDFREKVNCENVTEEETPSSTLETTTLAPTTTPSTPIKPQVCRWYPTQEIAKGERCEVENGYFSFQLDGNAVIYDINGKARWHSDTAKKGDRLVFEADGNLVIYYKSGSPVWKSDTESLGATLLEFRDDGNLVLYGTVWNAGSNIV